MRSVFGQPEVVPSSATFRNAGADASQSLSPESCGREAKGIKFTERSDEEVAEEMQRTA